MKLRGQMGIVLLAFAVGAVALVSGNLMLSLGRSPAMDSLMHSRLGTWAIQTWLDQTAPTPAPGLHQASIGEPRIDLDLPDAQGQIHKLSQWDGKRVLLNFWATWCAPCREEMPLLRQAQQQYADQGVQIIGIAVDKPDHVQDWLTRHPSNYPVLIDEPDSHPATSSYGNTRALLPYSVLIGRDGIVLKRKMGLLMLTNWRIGWGHKPARGTPSTEQAPPATDTQPARTGCDNDAHLRHPGADPLLSGPFPRQRDDGGQLAELPFLLPQAGREVFPHRSTF